MRDLGGYVTSNGRSTRWKNLLRADSLHKLPPESQAALIDYGLRTVIDLRSSKEIEEAPNVFVSSSEVGYYHHNIAGDATMANMMDPASAEKGARRLVRNYTKRLDQRPAQVIEPLATLAAPEILPALFYCTAGKDRTGLISALVLGLAGVSAETIVEDYTLSARYLLSRYRNKDLLPFEQSAPATPVVPSSDYTWEEFQRDYCPPEAMRATLQHLDEHYGGIEAYVLKAGLTQAQIDRLRSAVLE